MPFPSQNDFLKDSFSYTHIPVYEVFPADFDTALSLYTKIEGDFLLESVENGNNVGRYSIIAKGKQTEFVFEGKTLTINKYDNGNESNHSITHQTNNPLSIVKDYFSKIKVPHTSVMPADFPPFYGGAIGYLGYETVTYFEDIPIKQDDNSVPDGILIIPDLVLVLDNVKQLVYVIYCLELAETKRKTEKLGVEHKYRQAEEKIAIVLTQINTPIPNPYYKDMGKTDDSDDDSQLAILSNFKRDEFLKAVEKCREYIHRGDVIQVVLSQQFKVKTGASPLDLYRTLRNLNPSPYLFFLDFGSFQIIGSSPEMMVRVIDDQILLKPIAGTRPRGKSVEEDNALAKDLLQDAKELSEHLMLVDLGRNDLGRVAKAGSVLVEAYMSVERYSHVMHIVSSVKADMRHDKDVFDVIAATFPAGTLSGAPKIRAMEIITELEPSKRGPYGGMVLTLGFNLNLNSCITIRAMLLKENETIIQVGAGLVADSNPESEYQETLNKAQALFQTIKATSDNNKIQRN